MNNNKSKAKRILVGCDVHLHRPSGRINFPDWASLANDRIAQAHEHDPAFLFQKRILNTAEQLHAIGCPVNQAGKSSGSVTFRITSLVEMSQSALMRTVSIH